MAAQEALQRSVILANSNKHEYATVSSLLHAVVEEPRCDATKTLQATGVNLRKLRRSLSHFKAVDGDGGRQLNAGGAPTQMSAGLYRALGRAQDSAIRDAAPQISTRDLLLGSIDQAGGELSGLLHENGVDANLIRATAVQVNELLPLGGDPEAEEKTKATARPRFMISPVFLALVGITIGAGYVLYAMPEYATYALFAFVIAGWIVSLALHEFGHALVAYIGGDYSVVDKGYLTLNPLNYTHSVLSIVMPVVILLMGGIGLPGGAVYINRAALRSPIWDTFVSAAGPLANMLFAGVLVLLYTFFIPEIVFLDHMEFWAGIALLIFLQVTAILLNLLPVPGLDGFGIIEPWLPPSILQLAAPLYRFGFMILIMLFWYSDAFSSWFWSIIGDTLLWLGIDPSLAMMGLDMFMFWK